MLLSFLKLGFSYHIAGGFEVCDEHCCGMKHIYHICARREATEHEMDKGQLAWVRFFKFDLVLIGLIWPASNTVNIFLHINEF